MDEFLQTIYLRQVTQECEYCFEAIKRLNSILERKGEGDLFREALDLVHHSAAISRIFWPPGSRNKHSAKRAQRRGQALRDILSLKSGHPIQDRTLRDHFEHFDERLDDWAEHSRNRNIVDRFIGSRNAIAGDAIGDADIIRHYDPARKVFSFRGEAFDIQALASGLDDIYQKATERLQTIEANKRLKRDASKAGAP